MPISNFFSNYNHLHYKQSPMMRFQLICFFQLNAGIKRKERGKNKIRQSCFNYRDIFFLLFFANPTEGHFKKKKRMGEKKRKAQHPHTRPQTLCLEVMLILFFSLKRPSAQSKKNKKKKMKNNLFFSPPFCPPDSLWFKAAIQVPL